MKQVVDAPATTTSASALPSRLNGAQKAAILLAALGEEQSTGLMKQLSDDEVHMVSHAMASMPVIGIAQTHEVLVEFDATIAQASFATLGGVEFAKQLLTTTFGSDTAGRIMDRLPGQAIRESPHFKSIQRAEPEQLAKILEAEHPQTVAIILSRMSSTGAARLLGALPPALRSDVALRMASLEHISPEVTQKIVTIIGRKLTAFGQLKRESFGGVRAVADVLNQMDAANSQEVLANIEEQQPSLADAIRHLMFVFDDLLLVDALGMKELVGRLDRRVLTLALKGSTEQLRAHFTQCMSQRGAAMMLEDMEALGPVKIRDVEGAQKTILTIVRQLEAEGVVSVKAEGAQQYVV